MDKETKIIILDDGSLKVISSFGDFSIPKEKVYSFYYTLIQAIHYLDDSGKLFDTYGKPRYSDIFSKEALEPAEKLLDKDRLDNLWTTNSQNN